MALSKTVFGKILHFAAQVVTAPLGISQAAGAAIDSVLDGAQALVSGKYKTQLSAQKQAANDAAMASLYAAENTITAQQSGQFLGANFNLANISAWIQANLPIVLIALVGIFIILKRRR